MKLRAIAKPVLKLTAEKKVIEYGELFEVDFERGKEILKATFKGKPVAELVEVAKSNEELEAKVSQLEEANKTLAAEKEAEVKKVSQLEETNKTLVAEKEAEVKKVSQLEETNKTLVAEKAELEKKVKELETKTKK